MAPPPPSSPIFVAFFVAVAWRLRLMALHIPLMLVTGAVTVAPPSQPATPA